MMKSVFFAIAICTLVSHIHCQNAAYNQNNNNHRIYFGENTHKNYKTTVVQTTENILYFNEKATQGNRDITQNGGFPANRIIHYHGIPFGGVVDNHPLIVKPVTPAEPVQYNDNNGYFGIRNVPLSTNTDSATSLGKIPTDVGLSTTMTKFGLNLLKVVQNQQPGNAVFSPYSIAVSLGLLQQGALGDTQRQISEALQMTAGNSAGAFKKSTDEVKKQNSRNILRVATNLFVANGFSLNPDFKRVAINSFASDVTPTSFSRPDLAVNDINRWVAERTENKITKLLSTDSVSQNTQLVLVNAVFFKGIWKTQFNPDYTIKRNFNLRDGLKKDAAFMRLRTKVRGGYDPAIYSKIVDIPFEAEQYSLMLILPHEKANLDSVINTLTDAQLLAYNSLPILDVQLEIPKFTVESATDLNPVLQRMGVTSIFGQNSELHGIGNFRNMSVQVSSAKHSAILSIDEQGGTAAAATAFAVVALSYDEPALTFKADRPFLAVLWNKEQAMPFFMARIEEPTL